MVIIIIIIITIVTTFHDYQFTVRLYLFRIIFHVGKVPGVAFVIFVDFISLLRSRSEKMVAPMTM